MHMHAHLSFVSQMARHYLDVVKVVDSFPVQKVPLGVRLWFFENQEEVMSNGVKQVIVVRKDLNMRKGKIAAQVAHASMKFLTDNNEAERGDEVVVKLSPAEAMWLTGSFTKIVVSVDSQDALEDLVFRAELEGVEVHPIVDSGKTEFDGVPTLTCAAFGPCDSFVLDRLTGNLKLM